MLNSIRIILVSIIVSTMALADVFISENAEGSSNNKYLEFYNSGTEAVDLNAAGYAIANTSCYK